MAETVTYNGIIPYLNVEGASAAVEFYKTAFAATEVSRMPAQDGKRLMHCHLRINDHDLFLSDCFPEDGYPFQPSQSFSVLLVVEGAKAWWQRALDAGAEITLPLQVMFWGDEYGQLRDPFGVNWAINEPAKAD